MDGRRKFGNGFCNGFNGCNGCQEEGSSATDSVTDLTDVTDVRKKEESLLKLAMPNAFRPN
ncbi:hypothetical protein [Microcoleus sp. OTE_8_concoct_300]|uniref:hypothetical protein n=1 Tax=Microcoleus sp. OTE_8_concoct_300 TaxID=2964710 RepID=UPI00403F262E